MRLNIELICISISCNLTKKACHDNFPLTTVTSPWTTLPCNFHPGQLPTKTINTPPPPHPPPPRTITLWTITPQRQIAPPPPPALLPPGQFPQTTTPLPIAPPGHFPPPHLTRNFFCFCFGTRSLLAFSVRPWVHFQGRVQLELDYIRLLLMY